MCCLSTLIRGFFVLISIFRQVSCIFKQEIVLPKKIQNKKILQRCHTHASSIHIGCFGGPKIDRLGPLTTEADHSSGIDRKRWMHLKALDWLHVDGCSYISNRLVTDRSQVGKRYSIHRRPGTPSMHGCIHATNGLFSTHTECRIVSIRRIYPWPSRSIFWPIRYRPKNRFGRYRRHVWCPTY
jgi:hypothetical protein